MEIVLIVFWICFFLVFLAVMIGFVGILLGWAEEFGEWMGRRGWRYSTRELILAITVAAFVFGLTGALIRLAMHNSISL